MRLGLVEGDLRFGVSYQCRTVLSVWTADINRCAYRTQQLLAEAKILYSDIKISAQHWLKKTLVSRAT